MNKSDGKIQKSVSKEMRPKQFYEVIVFLWNCHDQNVCVFIDNIHVLHFSCFFDEFLSTNRHWHRWQMHSSRRLVPLFIWSRLHTVASQEKRKEAIPGVRCLGSLWWL